MVAPGEQPGAICGRVSADHRIGRVGWEYLLYCAMYRDASGRYHTDCDDKVLLLAKRADAGAERDRRRRPNLTGD